ncbi:MAG: hypothetical protein Q9165_000466 [Trypethelium subeluteriae]
MSNLPEASNVTTAEKAVEANTTSIPLNPSAEEPPKFVPSRFDAFLSTFSGTSLLINLQSTPIAFVNTLGPALLTGGPRVVFWGPLIGWPVATCVSGSLAEMASA